MSFTQPYTRASFEQKSSLNNRQHPFVYYTKIHTRSTFTCGSDCDSTPTPSITLYALGSTLFLFFFFFLTCVSFFLIINFFKWAVVERGMTMFLPFSLSFSRKINGTYSIESIQLQFKLSRKDKIVLKLGPSPC